MKIICVVTAIVLVLSCTVASDVEMELRNVRLVKIDTVFRYSQYRQIFTWQSDSRVTYYSFEDMDKRMSVGTSLTVMIKR